MGSQNCCTRTSKLQIGCMSFLSLSLLAGKIGISTSKFLNIFQAIDEIDADGLKLEDKSDKADSGMDEDSQPYQDPGNIVLPSMIDSQTLTVLSRTNFFLLYVKFTSPLNRNLISFNTSGAQIITKQIVS